MRMRSPCLLGMGRCHLVLGELLEYVIEAVIFDMDGLIIDSEPLWREAEIEVFATVGIALDDERCRETLGLRIDQVVDHWYRRFPWTGPSQNEIVGWRMLCHFSMRNI